MGGFSRARTSVVALQRTARAPRAAGHDDEERGEQTAAALATAAARAEASIDRRRAVEGAVARGARPVAVERRAGARRWREAARVVMFGASPPQ